jgi:hypothetical protein
MADSKLKQMLDDITGHTSDLGVFIAKTHRGFVGYVRINKGRVIHYTTEYQQREKALEEAERLKKVLEAHPHWWN